MEKIAVIIGAGFVDLTPAYDLLKKRILNQIFEVTDNLVNFIN